MSETIGVNVLQRASNMEISPQFDGYSAVRIFEPYLNPLAFRL